jgi:hypothetical protein
MNLPCEIMRNVLLCADIHALMCARQCARFIDALMNFEFWHDRFEMDCIPFLTLKVPMNCKNWIREYILIKNAMNHVDNLLYQNMLIVFTNSWLMIHDECEMSKDELETFLPNDIIQIYGFQNYGFSIRNDGVLLHGWTRTNYYVDAKLLLMRILYKKPQANFYVMNRTLDYEKYLV